MIAGGPGRDELFGQSTLRATVRAVGGEWDPDAGNWLRWARTPGFDPYWHFRDAFFDSVLPSPRGRTLEVGCGEGRVSRDLAARGHEVTAIDTARELVVQAHASDALSRYLLADGAWLPFRSKMFGAVVAYNVFQVVPDMQATVRECARVLQDGGHLCFCVAHPVTDLGRWIHDGEHQELVIRADYFKSVRVEEAVEQEGLPMTFRGWTHSLEAYALALQAAGFLIDVIREPTPTSVDRYTRWKNLPLFMNVRAVKR
jgi:SAM-dependent methyltransferase